MDDVEQRQAMEKGMQSDARAKGQGMLTRFDVGCTH
jgi:hypothetical protein